jgi:hypothetical protein
MTWRDNVSPSLQIGSCSVRSTSWEDAAEALNWELSAIIALNWELSAVILKLPVGKLERASEGGSTKADKYIPTVHMISIVIIKPFFRKCPKPLLISILINTVDF